MEETRLRIDARVLRIIDEFRGIRFRGDRRPATPPSLGESTYHRILERLRQQHAEAIMQETLDILRGLPAVFETGDGPLSLPTHEPYGFERARGALRLRELVSDAIIPSCRVVGHAPDCECATL